MMLLALTFRLLDAIRLFDTIFIMTGGGPGTQTYTASYYLYTVGFTQFHLSQATAGSWLFLIITALVVTLLVRRLLQGGADLMAAPSPRPAAAGAARRRSAASCSSASSSLFVLVPLYWMFNTSIKPSDDYLAIPPVWFPDEPTLVHYTAALFTYRGLEGLINSLIVSICGDGALGAARHADGLQPRPLQHRRPAPVLLGAVAALPAADRRSSCRSS